MRVGRDDAPDHKVGSRRGGADRNGNVRARGVDVYAETCVQYLVMDDSVFAKPDGHLYACCPQVKKPKDIERLWKGVNDGEVCVISTDTCTFTKKQKQMWNGDFTKIPWGMPGVETLLPSMYTYGVRKGHFSLNHFVNLISTNPARIMGYACECGVKLEFVADRATCVPCSRSYAKDGQTVRRIDA